MGLIISLFTSLYMTRLMFDFWIARKWLTGLRMMRLFERPTYNPMKYRFYLFSATTILTVLGLGAILGAGRERAQRRLPGRHGVRRPAQGWG